ncbi:diguanylate cyclase [Proteobacteria bacterium 005FR1]|nr:diguanylate cyclase [Proteobacteria bacterium 005FR1]
MTLKHPKRLVSYFAVGSIAAVAGLLVMDLFREYATGLSGLKRQLETEAELTVQQTEMSLRTVDLFLNEIAEEVASAGIESLAESPEYWHSLREALAYAPQIASVALIDSAGRARLSSTRQIGDEIIDLSNREYFEAHRQGTAYLINPPVISASTARRVVPVSTRIVSGQGEFLGVVAAGLDLGYFADFFRQMPENLDRRIAMFLPDGTLLSLHSEGADDANVNTADRIKEQLFRRGADTFVGPSPLDGRKSVVAVLPSDRYPLWVSVKVDHDAFLSRFYFTAWLHFLTFVLVGTILAFAASVLVRSIRKAQEDQEAKLGLLRSQRRSDQLSRTVIRHLPKGRAAVLDRELRYLFADGSEFELHESLSPAAVKGKTVDEIFPDWAAGKLKALALDALAGNESQKELAYGDRTYEVTAVPLEDEDGGVEQILLLTQDITDFKAIMSELESRNRELREISLTDPLLGIANRRAFDQDLTREWRRARRKQAQLALLMVDVDHFKIYNDEYGHAEGDQCLQEVASALESVVKRPGDMVARYGGEEFVVLLPDTDLAGAASVAERIHAQLAQRNLIFPKSPTAPCVTVSIGVSTILPAGDQQSKELIEHTDEALYAAKEEGRNRTAVYSDTATEALAGE